jgi:hypothetical protein
VLLEPVGRLLREIAPEGAGPDELEGHVLLLHHAYLFWAAQQPIYRISEQMLRDAVANAQLGTKPPQTEQYLQLPELRVWGSAHESSPPEPLDGMFVSRGNRGGIDVLAIFGMRPDRPGFSAVGLEGRADLDDPTSAELEIAATRADGSPAFGPRLAGGTAAGLYSVANAGELLLLTSRLVALLGNAQEA